MVAPVIGQLLAECIIVAALWGPIKFLNLFKGLKVIILGVWGGPGAQETLQKGGGEAPAPSEMAPEATGAARPPKRPISDP